MLDSEAALEQRIHEIRRRVLRPPSRMTVRQWADKFRILSAPAAERGRWRSERVPPAVGILETITEPHVRRVSCQTCTQLLKSEVLLNTIGYYAHQEPCTIIMMRDTKERAEIFSEERIAPMIADTPELTAIFSRPKSRDSGNTKLYKKFIGGQLILVGSNVPGDLADHPARVVLCDEIDKFAPSAGVEGDQLKLIMERQATFWDSKFISVCSPTLEPTPNGGGSKIAREYRLSDERIFELDCWKCKRRNRMLWVNVKYDDPLGKTAMFFCADCGEPWNEAERLRALFSAGRRPLVQDSEPGKYYEGYGWRGTKPFDDHAGFHAGKLASPWEPMSKLAKKWIEAQGNKEALKVFINTQLAETWKVTGDQPEWRRLFERRESYQRNIVPMPGRILAAGVDVQKDRLELEIVAYGRGLRSWSVDYRVFPGDTATLDSECWEMLRKVVNEEFLHEAGQRMRLDRIGIDARYNTQIAYNFVRLCGQGGRVMATQGHETSAVMIGIPTHRETRSDGKKHRRGVRVWKIGLNIAMAELYGFLNLERPEKPDAQMPQGWCSFPEYDEEFFKQLTAKQCVSHLDRRLGIIKHRWEKTRERDEALSCRIIARAVACAFGLDRWTEEHWREREAILGVTQGSIAAREANVISPSAPAVEAKREHPRREIVRTKSSFWSR